MKELRLISIIFSSISIVFELLNLFVILYHKALSKVRFEVVTYINLACLMMNVCFLLPYTPEDKTNWGLSPLCAGQSFILSFFETVKVSLTAILSYTVYLTVIKLDYLEKNIDIYRIVFLVVTLVTSLPIPLV